MTKENKLDKWSSRGGGEGYYYQNCDISHLWLLSTHTHTHTQMSREYILACGKKAFLPSLSVVLSDDL